MSVQISSLCWKIPLPPYEKLVLMRLADYADANGGKVYPAVDTVAVECGISPRQVQYILKDFVHDGLLVIVGNQTGGRGRTRRYAIDVDRATELGGPGGSLQRVQRVQRVHKPCTHNGHDETPQRVQRVHTDAEKGAQALHPTHQESVTLAVLCDAGAGAGEAEAEPEGEPAVDWPAPPAAAAPVWHQTHLVDDFTGEPPTREAVRAVIAAFDEERVAAYGPEQARFCPAATDGVFAGRFLSTGADLDLCRAVFRDRMQRNRRAGKAPIGSLEYFEQPIANAVAARNAPPVQGEASNVRHIADARSKGQRRLGAASYLERITSGGS